MPELPEVETTRRGIAPHLEGIGVRDVIVRQRQLRHPVSPSLTDTIGKSFTRIRRRSKYLIMEMEGDESLLVHLGMSGSLRLSDPNTPYRKHDHVILELASGQQLRYHDPRRFGIFLHVLGVSADGHPLLANLGPEPLSDAFTPEILKAACRSRRAPIKQVVMDAKVVVGVGNIYASESLFRAGIRPTIGARRISGPRLCKLVDAIREVLAESIEQGGTTLRDFLKSDGEPGYFKQRLSVYERAGEPCRKCDTPIRHAVLGQRSTYWCPHCQT